MHRFFVHKGNISEEEIIIDHVEDVKHIVKVLRLSKDDIIEVCDGENQEYIAKLSIVDKTQVKATILEKKESQTEAQICVTLFQGIPKSTKMDLIIQKCTELGINKITPVVTERTIVQLKDKKAEEKKIDRWQKIADTAAKQCKRGVIPKIDMPLHYRELLECISQYDLVIVAYEEEQDLGIKSILQASKKSKKIAIVVGPEGGFEKEEVEGLKEVGAKSVTLGPRILRTETAGFVALGIVMYEIGDLGGK
ncbi:16S rRNA (uracil(1498)-N(3))-methyltransferase [Lutibacter sp. B2]|nr:16S rRNA (uracil(1498)-N(3))-methyltransferase [Lutibacter sp. B2]